MPEKNNLTGVSNQWSLHRPSNSSIQLVGVCRLAFIALNRVGGATTKFLFSPSGDDDDDDDDDDEDNDGDGKTFSNILDQIRTITPCFLGGFRDLP